MRLQKFAKVVHFRLHSRSVVGNTVVEFGPALYIVFLVITVPLIAMGSVAVRYALLQNAANLAAQQASKAPTFNTDIPAASGSPGHLSCVHKAQQVASLACSQMGGGVVGLASTSVFIKIRPISAATAAPTEPSANQSLPPNLMNPTLYTYTCEVQLVGTIQPVFPKFNGLFGLSVPLLNAPLITTTRADYLFENNLNLSI